VNGTPPRVEAAGVVLVRHGEHGPEVAVVHRAKREDWSLPKGKLEKGERHDVAAVRETLEETGVRCVLGPSLGSRKYIALGAPKRVRYWRATVVDAAVRPPDAEIDEVVWLGRDAAHGLLTYDDDRALVDVALAMPDTTPTIVVRHARATKRAEWRGSGDPLAEEDSERPLSRFGAKQAAVVGSVLDAYRPGVVISSDARRCRDTVAPYADARGLTTRLVHALSEEGWAEDPGSTAAMVRELLHHHGSAVWCGHRPVLPTLLETLADELGLLGPDGHLPDRLRPKMKPGAGIVVHRSPDGAAVQVDRFET